MNVEYTGDVYVAFSIHGTNTFLTATPPEGASKWQDPSTGMLFIAGEVFTPAVSRNGHPGKLHWRMLNTRDGKPLRSPSMVKARFKRLEAFGWTVKGMEEFTAKHWPKRPSSPEARAVTQHLLAISHNDPWSKPKARITFGPLSKAEHLQSYSDDTIKVAECKAGTFAWLSIREYKALKGL